MTRVSFWASACSTRQAVRGHRRTRVLLVVILAALGFSSVFQFLRPVGALAQDALAQDLSDLSDAATDQLENGDAPIAIPAPPAPCSPGPGGACPVCTSGVPGASPYENSLPVPKLAPGFNYVVQLVNESNATILAAANAANRGSSSPGGPVPSPIAVEPREKTWVMLPKGAPKNGNVLTIDIPAGWEGTQCPQTNSGCGANGPRFFPRTGCKYDIAHNLAQCETGSCGDAYDCGLQALRKPPLASAGRTPVSIVEWTFNSQGGLGYEYPDISLVDGVNLTVDVQALGRHCKSKPGAPTEPNWLSQNQPLSRHGRDLRAATRCLKNFQLTRGEVGQIKLGGGGDPDDVVACFSNCGRYEYPSTPSADCDPDHDPNCKYWRDFCCFAPAGDPNHIYGGKCTSDSDCEQGGGCWDLGKPVGSVCACRAFIKNATCKASVCTHPNPPNNSSQPPFGHCSDVTGLDPSNDTACIGDDIVHKVFPGAYSWPNDPQTYSNDARVYRVIFAPGGTTVPITHSVTPIPLCSSFPNSIYGSTAAKSYCAGVPALFAGAAQSPKCTKNADCPIIPGSTPPSRYACNVPNGRCATWACKINDGGPVATGTTVCRW